MQYAETETGRSNRELYKEAKQLLIDSGIPGVKLKPHQACERVGIGLPLYYYYRDKEKGAVNGSDKPGTPTSSPKEGSDAQPVEFTPKPAKTA